MISVNFIYVLKTLPQFLIYNFCWKFAFHVYLTIFSYCNEITFSYRLLMSKCFISFFITVLFIIYIYTFYMTYHIHIHTTICILIVLHNSFSYFLQCGTDY